MFLKPIEPMPAIAAQMRMSSSDQCGYSFVTAKEALKPQTMVNLDETGLLGCVCRHGHPLQYIDIHTGERSYDVLCLLQHVIQECPTKANIKLTYDIVCQFSQSLRRLDPSIQLKVQVCLNAFHAYSYELKCQLLWSPIYTKGLGLTDGEGNERDWLSKDHLVAAGCISTVSHWVYLLEMQSMCFAITKRRSIFTDLLWRLKRAQEAEDQYKTVIEAVKDHVVKKYLRGDNPSFIQIQDFLQSQMEAQRSWFKQKGPNLQLNNIYPDMDVYQAFQNERYLEKHLHQYHLSQQQLGGRSSPVISWQDLYNNGTVAAFEQACYFTDKLLSQKHQAWEAWAPDTLQS